MYTNGAGVPQDYGEARRWYRMAAEQGLAEAQSSLGLIYDNGTGVPQDYGEAARWYRMAAEQGLAEAQNSLGFMYDNGSGVPQDYGEAARWYRKAAEQGDVYAQYNLALMYIDGTGVPQDYGEAARWYRMAAEQGDADAQFSLALMYDNGYGVPQDYGEAARWYREAAERGNADAQNNLGLMSELGEGVPQDYGEAARWYLKAAEQGEADAQNNLALMYTNGTGVPQDYGEATRWYRMAAEQGEANAQFNLALMYANGYGVPQDYGEAARWYREAADQGDADAQYNLALMYEDGYGVRQDYGEAARWYREAAEQGDADAQYNLALIYDNGTGVRQDYGEAVRWYLRAAEQSHARAQNNLGVMYGRGEGVPRDPVLAHMWSNLAASTLPPGEDRDMAVENRDFVAEQLSPSELVRAQQMARNWRPGLSEMGETASSSGLSEPPGPARELVQNIQEALAALGYDPGPADGTPGPQTREAIRAFQADLELPVTGEVSKELLLLARISEAVLTAEEEGDFEGASENWYATGSGFVVSPAGYALTNYHVVEGCGEIRLPTGVSVAHVASDPQTDLALLKIPGEFPDSASFRAGRGIRAGDDVVAIGFPLQGILTSDPSVTTGTISALAGPGDDRRMLQMTAPIQPGNSGGPLLDMSGNVVGVVVSKLDALEIAELTGDIPQNVNFAVHASLARIFLDAHNIEYNMAPSTETPPAAEIAASARKFTVLIECWE